MTDLTFGIHILASTLAISGAYALLMSILKKEVNIAWIRGEALFTLVAAGTALGFGFPVLFSDDSIYVISMLLLILGLGNALGLVVMQRLKGTPAPLPDHVRNMTRTLAILMFIAFTAHFLIELAALSRM